ITESCAAPAPIPVNHCSDDGTLHAWVVSGAVPDRSPSRPGASASPALITAASWPGSFETAPVLRRTVALRAPTVTDTSPASRLAVDSQPSDEPGAVAGQTTVALVSRVSAGCWVWSCTGGCR